jgi:outer membrane lipoprotein LolB
MKQAVAALAAAILLGACQSLPPDVATPSPQEVQPQWQARLERLSVIQHFELKGRIASSSLGGGSADLTWIQNLDHLDVSLSGTLGIGALRIEGTPDKLIIISRDGQYQADEAEQALTEKLGAPLPLSDLRFWVLGLPRPGSDSRIKLDDQGRLSHLEQEGWQLDYIEYREFSAGSPALPRKLWLSSGSNRWKLVVDQWNLPL